MHAQPSRWCALGAMLSISIVTACDDRGSALDASARVDSSVCDSCLDAGPLPDAGASSVADAAMGSDAGSELDASTHDAGSDGGTSAASDAGAADAGTPATATHCIDIDVSNTCDMTVTPREITIPAGQTAYFCWRNRSRDYPVDVWLSYGGGYTDLAPGATWNEPPGHCLGPTAHTEYADISTACSEFRFLIRCL